MELTELSVTLVTSLASAVLSAIVGYFAYKVQKRDKKRDAEMEARMAKEQEEARERKAEAKAVQDAVQCLLRDKLIYLIQKSSKEGFAPVYVVENVDKMYKSYHNLRGNGLITQMYERFCELPLGEEDHGRNVETGERNAMDK